MVDVKLARMIWICFKSSWSAYFQSILYIWLVWNNERILLPNLSHSTLYLVVIVVNYDILFTLIDVVVVVADFIIHRPGVLLHMERGRGCRTDDSYRYQIKAPEKPQTSVTPNHGDFTTPSHMQRLTY